MVPLKPLHDLYTIKRIVVSTYQSVSGAGKEPMDELISQTKQFLNNETIQSKKFTKQIAFNAIPHIDVFADDGYTKEELKMVNETKKILDDSIELTATCVTAASGARWSVVGLTHRHPNPPRRLAHVRSLRCHRRADRRADAGHRGRAGPTARDLRRVAGLARRADASRGLRSRWSGAGVP